MTKTNDWYTECDYVEGKTADELAYEKYLRGEYSYEEYLAVCENEDLVVEPPLKKRFEDFTREDLKELRNEIVLNSLFLADYENSFRISEESCCAFFDGYYNFLWDKAEEKAEEEGKGTSHLTDSYVFENFDNIDTLEEWYYCHEDFSWIKYVAA